jgi:uncharacterized protein YegL
MSRRFPIFFLIDVSESMVGEPIMQVKEGLANIIKELKTDPHALETVWLSIIVFAGQAKTLVPLQELVTFYPPDLPIGSGTSLSHGLGQLMFEMRRSVVKTSTERKGDWKPLVFLFTDGVPTSDTHGAIAEWQQNWKNSVNMVAIAIGDQTDYGLLSQLTENVLFFNDNKGSSYKEFFKWISASIKSQSVAVEQNRPGFQMPETESGGALSRVDLSKSSPGNLIDDNYAVFAAKCQTHRRPYLIKYGKTMVANAQSWGQVAMYRLINAYQVDQNYFELSDESRVSKRISTDKLMGAPSCPCCGSQVSFALCGHCNNIHCIDLSNPISTCPWCGVSGKYGMSDGDFDVNRTQG